MCPVCSGVLEAVRGMANPGAYKRKGLYPDASLLDEYARVVAEARPAAAILENVHGLAYRNHNRKPFDRLIGQLQSAGYRTRAKVPNAAE
jgi:DNA (cytosine-5)-methyltransferase 1